MKKFWEYLKFNKPEERSCYNSLESIPIVIWWEVLEGDLKKLVKSGNPSNLDIYNNWVEIMQDYYNHFGMKKEHKELLKLKKDYALSMAKYLKKQDYTSQMHLNMAKIKLNDSLNTGKSNAKGEETKLHEAISFLEYKLGFKLDMRKLSAFDFYRRQEQVNKIIEFETKKLSPNN